MSLDHARCEEMAAAREGRVPEPGDELALRIQSLLMTMMGDPDLFRAAMEYIGTITPVQTILERPDVQQRIGAVSAAMKGAPPPPMPGPDRKQLLELMN
jgi:hypothetical protein